MRPASGTWGGRRVSAVTLVHGCEVRRRIPRLGRTMKRYVAVDLLGSGGLQVLMC
jgi:hypothetical protein